MEAREDDERAALSELNAMLADILRGVKKGPSLGNVMGDGGGEKEEILEAVARAKMPKCCGGSRSGPAQRPTPAGLAGIYTPPTGIHMGHGPRLGQR